MMRKMGQIPIKALSNSYIYRWVIAHSTQINQRCRKHLRPSNDSLRSIAIEFGNKYNFYAKAAMIIID